MMTTELQEFNTSKASYNETEYQMVKKISPKVICGQIKKCEEGDLMMVYGVISAIKIVQTNFSESIGFKGEIEAYAINNPNIIFRSAVVYLPEIATIPLQMALQEEKNVNCEFGFIIGKKNVETTSIGYEYTIKPILKPTETDSITRIKKIIAQKMDAQKTIGEIYEDE